MQNQKLSQRVTFFLQISTSSFFEVNHQKVQETTIIAIIVRTFICRVLLALAGPYMYTLFVLFKGILKITFSLSSFVSH